MLLATLVAPLLAAAPAREQRVAMGTSAEIQVAGLQDPRPALEAAFAAMGAVEASTSLGKPGSELQALNRTGAARASPLLFEALRVALDVARDSQGAFDPTVEPLLRAAGLLGDRGHTPGAAERRRLLASVGFARVQLDPATRQVRLEPGTRLVLDGIAKGHAADLALAELRRAGASAGLVDLGRSSMAVFGLPLTLGVPDPGRQDAAPWAVLTLTDGALGSSGLDPREGQILDPRDGKPAEGLLATTVVARTAIEADALSAAFFVLGAEQGLALLARRGAEGFCLLHDAQGRRLIRASPGFTERYDLEPRPAVHVRE